MTVVFLLSTPTFAASIPKDWQTHRDRDYGFSIAYPKDFTFYGADSYSSLARPEFCMNRLVACFVYSGNEYEGTTLVAAGLVIRVLDVETKQECYKIDTGSYPVRDKTINGIHFRYADTDGVAAGTSLEALTYRTFHDQMCYEIALDSFVVNSAYSDPGTVKEYNPKKLDSELDQMLHTFRFLP